MSLLEKLQSGGPLMFAILAVALVAAFTFAERLYALQKNKVVPQHFIAALKAKANTGLLNEALQICRENPSSIAPIFTCVLQQRNASLSTVKEAVQDVGIRQAALLERGVKRLGTLASLSPLLGFLGSATGMLSVFQNVTRTGSGSLDIMAPGIYESLTTTAFGLAVGIPIFIGHRLLLSHVESLTLKMEQEALLLLDVFYPPSQTKESESQPL